MLELRPTKPPCANQDIRTPRTPFEKKLSTASQKFLLFNIVNVGRINRIAGRKAEKTLTCVVFVFYYLT